MRNTDKKMAVSVGSCGDINALPADCIANVLSLTTPKDACRLSLVATSFRTAAQADGVWKRFLPSDYRDIISRSIGGSDTLLREFQWKKDLYLHLSDHPILIDSGRMSFMLEKPSGKKCYMLAARDLCIIWGDTSQYWEWKFHPESRFSEVAELLNVCWLEIRGCIHSKMLSFDTNYAAYIVFKADSGLRGFGHLPAEASFGIKGHGVDKRTVFLDSRRRRGSFFNLSFRRKRRLDDGETEDNNEFLKRREDGWMEVELGEYFVTGGDDEIEMSLLEVKILNWKSGLVIQGIEIRPKECN